MVHEGVLCFSLVKLNTMVFAVFGLYRGGVESEKLRMSSSTILKLFKHISFHLRLISDLISKLACSLVVFYLFHIYKIYFYIFHNSYFAPIVWLRKSKSVTQSQYWNIGKISLHFIPPSVYIYL